MSGAAGTSGARSRRPWVLTSLALIVVMSAALPVDAHAQAKNGKNSGTQDDNDLADVPGDDIFGFTSATDVGSKGDLGFANELTGFRGKRDGSYRWLSNKMELGYTFAENWWIAGSAFISNHRINGVTDLDDRDATAFEGLSFEIKHRVIERSKTNPFAVTLSAEPFRSWIDLADGTGRRADGYGAAFKVYADAAIVPDKIFWAANVVWAPFRQQTPDDRSVWLEGSGTSLLDRADLPAREEPVCGSGSSATRELRWHLLRRTCRLCVLPGSDTALEDHRQDRLQRDLAAADRRPLHSQSGLAL